MRRFPLFYTQRPHLIRLRRDHTCGFSALDQRRWQVSLTAAPPSSLHALPRFESGVGIAGGLAGESVVTIEKLQELIDMDEELEVLNESDSVLGKVLIEKCETEIMKLLNEEKGEQFDKVVSFLEGLVSKLDGKANTGLRKRLQNELTGECFYVFRVIEDPSNIIALFHKEIERIIQAGTNETKASQLLTLMKFSSLLINHLQGSKEEKFSLGVMPYLLSEVANIFVSTGQSYEFFECLIRLNASFSISHPRLSLVRSILRNGSSQDKRLYFFYQIFESPEPEASKAKLIQLYSFKMIKDILIYHIQHDNHHRSSVYMDILVTKYALEKNRLDRLDKPSDKITQDLYSSMMYYSTKLGNYKYSLAILDKMVENDVGVTPKLCHILATSLRKKRLYDGSLSLFRIIPKFFHGDNSLSTKDKLVFINELIALFREKFKDPQMVLAHFITIFPDSINLLDDLLLVNPIVHKAKGKCKDLSGIHKAVLNEFFILKDTYPTIINITELYMCLFNYISISGGSFSTISNPLFYNQLFNAFIKMAKRIQSKEKDDPRLKSHPFSSKNLDEGILNIFIRRILRDFNRPKMALSMTRTYLKELRVKRFDAENLVHIFYKHPQASGRSYEDLVALLTFFKIDLSLPLIVASIFKSYNRGEVASAKGWYELLLQRDFQITNRRFIKFVHAQGWEFPKNFNYKLLDHLNLSNSQRNMDNFSMYTEEEEDNLETFDDEFVKKLIDELNEIHERSKHKNPNSQNKE